MKTPIRFIHCPTQAEFELFARISGDDNPIHVDSAFSEQTRFGRNVAHGMYLYTVIWGRLSAEFPGFRTRSQALKFPNPSFAGETLVFELDCREMDCGVTIQGLVTREADGAVTCEAFAELVSEAIDADR